MTLRMRAVAVKQLPETLDAKQGRLFFSELESCVNIDRPWLVLDCSKVRHLDGAVVHLLLCLLEEAMKRNGDVKLASIPPAAATVLELAGIDRLFEAYATSADAVASFRRPLDINALMNLTASSQQRTENAA